MRNRKDLLLFYLFIVPMATVLSFISGVHCQTNAEKKAPTKNSPNLTDSIPQDSSLPPMNSGQFMHPSTVKAEDYPFALPYQIEHSIANQIPVPSGFIRPSASENSFSEWIHFLPLYPRGRDVLDYQGNRIKSADECVRVVLLDNPAHGMQQCADTVIRLWGEFLKAKGKLDRFTLHTQNGQNSTWAEWETGLRPKLSSNRFTWSKTASPTSPSTLLSDFNAYLSFLMKWTGTLALDRDLKKVSVNELIIGDCFVHANRSGNNIGHISMIVDQAFQTETQTTVYLLAYGFIPAQDFHIILPETEAPFHPWFQRVDFENQMEATFGEGRWVRFSP